MILALTGWGCAWSQPPTPSSALVTPFTITGVTPKVDAGQFFLTETGLWAFLPEVTAERTPSHQPKSFVLGEVIGLLPHDSVRGHTHLFGVVQVNNWGVLMQRLDQRPVLSTAARGQFVPLYDAVRLREWGVCRGSGGDVGMNACVQAAGPQVNWRLFHTDAAGRLQPAPIDDTNDMLPLATAGVVIDGRVLMGQHGPHAGATADGWLAVPMPSMQATRPRGAPPLAHSRILLGPTCPEVDAAQSIQPLELLRAELSAPEGPVEVEARAIRTGVDVMVRCANGAVDIDVPVLYRPLMTLNNVSAAAIPYGAMHPLRAADNPQAMQASILLGAALGTGAWLAADFYLEAALRAAPESDASRHLGRTFMQVFAVTGRPELALRAGRRASRGAWHVANDPAYLVGQAWAHAALGDLKTYASATQRYVELAPGAPNGQLRDWLAWNTIRADAEDSGQREIRGAMSYYEGAGLLGWLAAANQLIAPGLRVEWNNSMQDAQPGDDLALVFEPAPVEACPGGACQLDVYGRNLRARLAQLGANPAPDAVRRLSQDLTSTAPAALRPGFDPAGIDTSQLPAAVQVSLRAALLALHAPHERPAALATLFELGALALHDAGGCAEIAGARAIEARLRHAANQHNSDRALFDAASWLVGDAFRIACESPLTFVANLEARLGDDANLTRLAMPLLTAVMSAVDAPEERAEMLRQGAAFSTRHKTGAECTRLNLALALSNLDAGQLDAAATNLGHTTNCTDAREDMYAASKQLIQAFIQFETDARIAPDLPVNTRDTLLRLTRRTPVAPGAAAGSSGQCFGLLPLNYQLEDYIDPAIVALRATLKRPTRDEFARQTSSRTLDHALSALDVFGRLLAEGRPQAAALALADARQGFSALGHRAGMQRLGFLETVLYEGDLDGYIRAMSGDLNKKKASGVGAQKRAPAVSVEAAPRLSARDWAHALQQGQADLIAKIFAQHDAPQSTAALQARLAAAMLTQGVSGDLRALEPLIAQTPALTKLCE